MREFTVVIDYANYYSDYKELIAYIKALKGVSDFKVEEDTIITIDVKYDEKLITEKIIFLEIEAFLNLQRYPCLYSFDRHSKEKLILKKVKPHICCECCFANIIYNLFETSGIEKVESDFYEVYYEKHDVCGEYSLNISYDPNKISKEKWAEIKKEIDIYS